jgi:predicted lipoprotein with Yx(FWY)xxD motif
MPRSLDDLLEIWTVLPPGMWDNDQGPKDWYAVANDDGIKSYFGDEAPAYRWRMEQINREINP